jgi:hypothetical protein
MTVTLDEMRSLVGRPFPGGTYTVERWENVMLHEVTAAAPSPGGLVHPIGLFHVPLAACGWTYAEIFEICRAESDEAVRAGEYRWELHAPMREGVRYDVTGEFVDVERKQGRRGGIFDAVTFRLRLVDHAASTLAATVTNTWLFLRSDA